MNRLPSTCPSCGKPAPEKSLGEKGAVRLLKCGNCRLVFADRAFWKDPYERLDYYGPTNQPTAHYPLVPSATDRDRIDSLWKKIQSGYCLDYGGGLGTTALEALRRGLDVTVIEDSGLAVEKGRQYHPEIHWKKGNTLANEPDGALDAVTLFHVLEHILDLRPFILDLHRILRPGGILVVEVPNWGSHTRRLRGMNWLYVMDHHVNYFDAASLTKAFENNGFKRVNLEHRRAFAVNERIPWREPLKRVLCLLGFAEILRITFQRL